MEYITAKEAAEKWGISQHRVRLGWAWAIPRETDKRSDAHIKDL